MINNYKKSKGKYNNLTTDQTITEYILGLEEIIRIIEERYILPF